MCEAGTFSAIWTALHNFYAELEEIQCPIHVLQTCTNCDGGYLEVAINNSIACTLLVNQFVVDATCPCVCEGKAIQAGFKSFVDRENAKQTASYKRVTLQFHNVKWAPSYH